MKLTTKQKEAIIDCNFERDYCGIFHRSTMQSLENKGLARFTSGFGFKFGEIIELTAKGKELRKKLINQ